MGRFRSALAGTIDIRPSIAPSDQSTRARRDAGAHGGCWKRTHHGRNIERFADTWSDVLSAFSDPHAIADYAERAARLVPGLHALHRMTGLLLAESVMAEGRVLVLGAGGGVELKVFADMQPGWRFVGIDPSADMLALAKLTLGELTSRVDFREGYIDAAPEGPFDAATCLLTLHFIPAEERLRTLTELRRRLRPGAPLVVAHHSVPQGDAEKIRWLNRYAAFAGVPEAKARSAAEALGRQLPILSPEHDETLLRKAGFDVVEMFYAAFTFKGWIAYNPSQQTPGSARD